MKENFSNIKALFIDIDNTLVHGQDINSISQENIDVLKKVQEHNIYVILATGRSEEDAVELRKKIYLNNYGDYTIVSNGSKIFGKNLETIEKNYLSKDTFKALIDFGVKNNYPIKIANKRAIFTNDFFLRRIVSIFYKKYPFTDYKELDKTTYVDDNYAKIGFFFLDTRETKKAFLQIKERFEKICEVVITGRGHYIEVTEKNISKSFGAKVIAEKLKIDLKNTIAFGDSMNDYDLFKSVGFGVAVENAMDDLKKIATHITGSVKESGVANFIKENILVNFDK